jgi:hypothetical protein
MHVYSIYIYIYFAPTSDDPQVLLKYLIFSKELGGGGGVV